MVEPEVRIDMLRYYERGLENQRLATGSRLEFIRIKNS